MVRERNKGFPVGELSRHDRGIGRAYRWMGRTECFGLCRLQRLVDQGILAARRDGNHVYYRIIDPCVTVLLDLALCLTEETRRRTTTR